MRPTMLLATMILAAAPALADAAADRQPLR